MQQYTAMRNNTAQAHANIHKCAYARTFLLETRKEKVKRMREKERQKQKKGKKHGHGDRHGAGGREWKGDRRGEDMRCNLVINPSKTHSDLITATKNAF